MDWLLYSKAFSGLAVVLALIIALYALLRWLKDKGHFGAFSRSGQNLKVVESLFLDTKRQVVIVQHNTKQYLLLLGPTDLLLATLTQEDAPQDV